MTGQLPVANGATPARLERKMAARTVIVSWGIPAGGVRDGRRHLVASHAEIGRVTGRATGAVQTRSQAMSPEPPEIRVVVRRHRLVTRRAGGLQVAQRTAVRGRRL